MWIYEKKLEYPINIKHKDLKLAKAMFSQYGGPYGEITAAMQYLNQRYGMPDDRGKQLLSDIGSEELGHCEMIAAIILQLMQNATIDELKQAGLEGNFAQINHSLFPSDANGVPFSSTYTQTTGDYISDIESDMAAEQRARATYEHLMDMTSDQDVLGPLSFLRQREIVHYQRFKELRDYYLKNKIQ